MRGILFLLVLLTLMPAAVIAGQLEPPGPPAPTMKSLDEIPPTWSQILDSTDGDQSGCDSTRFKCVMGGAAVLDLETGLVWQRNPGLVPNPWLIALDTCKFLEIGGRYGWRGPALEEFQSLLDTSQSNPALPAGNPFGSSPTNFGYWTATTDWGDTTIALKIQLTNGSSALELKNSVGYIFCVRGGSPNVFTSQPNQ